GEICHDQVRGQQALVHGQVDDPGMLDLVRAFARESGHLGCRLDDVSISLIEIKILVLLEIGLLAVAHNHKATGHGVLPVWPRARIGSELAVSNFRTNGEMTYRSGR